MKLYVKLLCRTLVVGAFLFGFSAFSNSSAAVGTTGAFKSYREWKTSMVTDAEARFNTTRENFFKTRTTSQTATEAGLQDSLSKDSLQLSLAKDLTISDYFVGYLTKQKSLPQAIKEVSGRLTPEEVAELMTAYANYFFSSSPTPTSSASRADSGL